MLEGNRAVTTKEAARLAGVTKNTINRWIQQGFLKIAPRWGKEQGDRVFVHDLYQCISTPLPGRPKGRASKPYRCPRHQVWYKRQIARTRFRRLLETPEEREKRLSWQRDYGRKRAKGLKKNA